MKNAGCRQPVCSDRRNPWPRQAVLLTTPPKRASPEVGDVVPEGPQCPSIRGHRVVREVARDHSLQPLTLFGNGIVHACTQLDLDLLESRHHAVTPCLSLKLEGSAAGL